MFVSRLGQRNAVFVPHLRNPSKIQAYLQRGLVRGSDISCHPSAEPLQTRILEGVPGCAEQYNVVYFNKYTPGHATVATETAKRQTKSTELLKRTSHYFSSL